MGYADYTLSNIMVTTGKEMVLIIEIEESLTGLEGAVVKAKQNKAEALNDMASVSARTFSVEETQRYAAAMLDQARMVQNYAGVSGGYDLVNEIILRGNIPQYLPRYFDTNSEQLECWHHVGIIPTINYRIEF